jgi:hypothetical protein
MNTAEVAAKVMTALTEVSLNKFHEGFQNFINESKSMPLPKGTNLKEILCKQMEGYSFV